MFRTFPLRCPELEVYRSCCGAVSDGEFQPNPDISLSLVMLDYGRIGVRLIWLAAIHAVEVVDSSPPTVSPLMIQPQNRAGNAGS